MNCERGDIVLLPFPFVTSAGVHQKARPALVVSSSTTQRRFDDVTLVAITSQHIDEPMATEVLVKEESPAFGNTGLAHESVIRCEFLMTVPMHLVARKLGRLPKPLMADVDRRLLYVLGIDQHKS